MTQALPFPSMVASLLRPVYTSETLQREMETVALKALSFFVIGWIAGVFCLWNFSQRILSSSTILAAIVTIAAVVAFGVYLSTYSWLKGLKVNAKNGVVLPGDLL